MIKPYTAVGLIPTVRGIRKRKDIAINLEHFSHLVKAASWLSSLDLPVRLIAFPEGALQGVQRRGARSRSRDSSRARRHRHSRRRDRVRSGKIAQRVRRVRHGAGQGAPSRSQGPVLQRRLHPRPARAR